MNIIKHVFDARMPGFARGAKKSAALCSACDRINDKTTTVNLRPKVNNAPHQWIASLLCSWYIQQ